MDTELINKGIDYKKTAMRVSAVSIAVNILLSLFKLFAGVFAGSGAMISDAVHSASDVFSTVIVMIGINISSKNADKEHPYGHERFECVAAVILAAILAATGIGIGMSGAHKIVGGDPSMLAPPGSLALAAAVISILVKEWMFWFTRKAAKKIDSGALMADAWHHRSDALSSVGAFLGIFGARMGYPILDCVASVVICIFILKAAMDIFRDAIDKLIDKACDEQTTSRIEQTALDQQGVASVDEIKTRLFGAKIYVDMEISADANLLLKQSHDIAHLVHDAIERELPEVKHCTVHVNPCASESLDS